MVVGVELKSLPGAMNPCFDGRADLVRFLVLNITKGEPFALFNLPLSTVIWNSLIAVFLCQT